MTTGSSPTLAFTIGSLIFVKRRYVTETKGRTLEEA
jgi:hypothetical protein